MWTRIAYFAAIVVCVALGFVGTSMLLDRPVSNIGSGRPPKSGDAGTRCELRFPLAICPTHPSLPGISTDSILVDNYEGSGSNSARCIQRAREYFAFCGFQQPVVARFYRGGQVVESGSWPQ